MLNLYLFTQFSSLGGETRNSSTTLCRETTTSGLKSLLQSPTPRPISPLVPHTAFEWTSLTFRVEGL